jgi:hypothetical protein
MKPAKAAAGATEFATAMKAAAARSRAEIFK